MFAVAGGGDIVAHAVEDLQLPWAVVDRSDVGGLGIVELVV